MAMSAVRHDDRPRLGLSGPDDDADRHVVASEGPDPSPVWQVGRTPMTAFWWLGLRGLYRDVGEIRVGGTANAWLPGEVETIRIEVPREGVRRIGGERSIVHVGAPRPLNRATTLPALRYGMRLHFVIPAGAQAWAVPVNERGEPIGPARVRPENREADTPAAPAPDMVVLPASIEVAGRPAAIVVKVLHGWSPVDRPFEVTVGLRHAASQPSGPQPLAIEGDAPLEVGGRVERIGPHRLDVVWRFRNHTNKAIVRVSGRAVWTRRSDGTERSEELSIDGAEGFAPGESILVPAGGDAEREISLFDADPWHEPTDCVFRIRDVTFADDSTWHSP